MRRGLRQNGCVQHGECATRFVARDAPMRRGLRHTPLHVDGLYHFFLRRARRPDEKGIETFKGLALKLIGICGPSRARRPDEKGIET